MQLYTTQPMPVQDLVYIVEPSYEIKVPSVQGITLEDLMAQYCFWEENVSNITPEIPERRFVTAPIEPSKKSKKRCIEEIDFTDKITLLSGIIEGILKSSRGQVEKCLITSKRKPNTPKGKKSSHRRSRYIGVSKNGCSHQVLISVNGRKTYLGSFENEYEAAITFDFYSILLHSIEAKTNFSYTPSDVQEMIHNYKVYKNLAYFYPKFVHDLHSK